LFEPQLDLLGGVQCDNITWKMKPVDMSMCILHSLILFNPTLQVLQCLSGQGLTSSGGSGQVGSEGGNSSGASRAAVKERLV
jgi:hypothetical protein